MSKQQINNIVSLANEITAFIVKESFDVGNIEGLSQFFALILSYEKRHTLSPSPDIDVEWKTFISDNQMYTMFCNKFGNVDRCPELYGSSVKLYRTLNIVQYVFGANADKSWFNDKSVPFEWCSNLKNATFISNINQCESKKTSKKRLNATSNTRIRKKSRFDEIPDHAIKLNVTIDDGALKSYVFKRNCTVADLLKSFNLPLNGVTLNGQNCPKNLLLSKLPNKNICLKTSQFIII
jgi:hypothetical protein